MYQSDNASGLDLPEGCDGTMTMWAERKENREYQSEGNWMWRRAGRR